MSLLKELRIPHMGSVENAKLLNWLLPEGSAFKAGQPLYEIETDKTVLEVEAEADGVLARCEAAEGADLKVGDRVGYAAAAGATAADIAAALAALAPAGGVAAPAASSAAAPSSSAGGGGAAGSDAAARVSPLVRRLAAEHGVDLSQVKGSGPGGRIVGDDVLAAANTGAAASARPAPSDVPTIPGYAAVPVEARPNSTRRRAIARRLAESARETATLTADMQIDLGAMLELRASRNAALSAQGQPTVSMLAYIAQALCRVLKQRPDFNATFTDSHTLRWQVVNLGIAIDTDEGLVVPVIREAERLSLAALESNIRTLAERARQGHLRAEELEGGTFTLSNPGSLGPVLRAEAVLNPPQVALLGLPAMLRVPVVVADAQGRHDMAVRPVIRPSLTFDHRALDGGQVIHFLNDLRHLIEGASPEAFQ